jgi:glycosyltransferase involved in cell wall biosynthesis
MPENCELTILMPCLNEAETLAVCIDKARGFIARSGASGEIVVADNGSTDGSQAIAREHGARVVDIPTRGYGSALRGGIAAAKGTFVIMGDSDDSYDFRYLDLFVEKLREGYDLVLGNRFAGGIARGAMPPLHRYFGNPLLTLLGRILYQSPSKDFYCGLRGFRRDAVLALDLDAKGMEFALEMIVKASIAGLRMTEVPTTLSPDGRSRPPHLRSWRDGWRSLRFFLLLSPRGLFLYPGLTLVAFGLAVFSALIGGDLRIGRVVFAEHTLIIGCTAIVIGTQAVLFWVFAKVAAMDHRLLPPDPGFERWRNFASVELGTAAGGSLILLGFAGDVGALLYWGSLSFGLVWRAFLIRVMVTASMLTILGFQLLYSSFLLYLLDYVGQKVKRSGGQLLLTPGSELGREAMSSSTTGSY